MRIGLIGGAATPEKIIEQAVQAEADGFASLWYASVVQGDPLVAMALAGRATSTIELGTAVLQTYPCHPLLQAQRAASVAAAMGRPGFTLGIGPSHEENMSGIYGLSYDHPGRNTDEYVRILTALLRGDGVEFEGVDWTVRAPAGTVVTPHPIPVLLSALSPRLLRIAGEHTDGTVLWMASVTAIGEHVVPRITAAAAAAGRPTPRVVAGLPLAVHDDVAEARAAVNAGATMYASRPNYQRIMAVGRASTAGDAAIIGDEEAVEAQLQALFDAGATDVHVIVIPVGDDRRASRKRAMDLLMSLC
jgi:F420-dependent oxidoreductase-like protein